MYQYYKFGGLLSSRKVNTVFDVHGKYKADQISNYLDISKRCNSMSIIKNISDEYIFSRLPEPSYPHDLSYNPIGKWYVTGTINRYLESGAYLFYKNISEVDTSRKWHLHIPNGKIKTGLYWEEGNGTWIQSPYKTGDMFLYSQVPCIMINALEDSQLICVTYEWFDQEILDTEIFEDEYQIAVSSKPANSPMHPQCHSALQSRFPL